MIKQRSKRSVSVLEFASAGSPDNLGKIHIECPYDRQYVLRMPIKVHGSDFVIPSELSWMEDLFREAYVHQCSFGSFHSFCYITVRHGYVESTTDDEWHVDGFSTRVKHVPEQNYVWCSEDATEYVDNLQVKFPEDFDPLIHNVNSYLERFVQYGMIKKCNSGHLYCMDPYILHRRPKSATGYRTFVRISFVPIEIDDINNTQNTFLPRKYTRDGVKLRNELKNYGD